MIRVNVKKTYRSGARPFTIEVDLEIKSNQLVTLFGASGAGKTTLLNMIAGTIQPDEGIIEVAGEKWFDRSARVNLKLQKRKVGMVFQQSALFANMSVIENLKYAASGSDNSRVDEVVDFLDLNDLKDRKPNMLSGGQQQRVALGRAIAQHPELLLLDEPLSALDDETRYSMQEQILAAKDRFNLTIIMVSHDVAEILRMSDLVYLMDNGRIKEHGSKSLLYSNRKLSGKFQCVGTVVEVLQEDFLQILHVLEGNNLIKVVVNDERENFQVGDKVIVAAKGFNPLVKKVS